MKYIKIHKSKLNEDFIDSYNHTDYNEDEIDADIISEIKDSNNKVLSEKIPYLDILFHLNRYFSLFQRAEMMTGFDSFKSGNEEYQEHIEWYFKSLKHIIEHTQYPDDQIFKFDFEVLDKIKDFYINNFDIVKFLMYISQGHVIVVKCLHNLIQDDALNLNVYRNYFPMLNFNGIYKNIMQGFSGYVSQLSVSKYFFEHNDEDDEEQNYSSEPLDPFYYNFEFVADVTFDFLEDKNLYDFISSCRSGGLPAAENLKNDLPKSKADNGVMNINLVFRDFIHKSSSIFEVSKKEMMKLEYYFNDAVEEFKHNKKLKLYMQQIENALNSQLSNDILDGKKFKLNVYLYCGPSSKDGIAASRLKHTLNKEYLLEQII